MCSSDLFSRYDCPIHIFFRGTTAQFTPFPEYTSGHSVISRAAALALTDIYGENFQFNDTSELEYGLPARKFNSFISASEEAAISRLYGGIHYMMV